MKKKAFTLIEVIIVIVLVSMMVAVTATVFLTGLKAWVSGMDRTNIREEAVLAMERMVRDLSHAGPISAATSSTITFTGDVDNDATNETVTFSLSGNNLTRTVDGAATTITPYAQTLGFTYVNSAGATITPADQAARDTIRVVNVSLTMSKTDETYTLTSSAYTRNQTT